MIEDKITCKLLEFRHSETLNTLMARFKKCTSIFPPQQAIKPKTGNPLLAISRSNTGVVHFRRNKSYN